jgi:PAS domain S-box-containing protein
LTGDRDIIGKPVKKALPELDGQGLFDLLDRVYQTGEPFVAHALPVMLQRVEGGELEERFVNFVYQPIKDYRGKVAGIFVEGSDVTDAVRATRSLRESEERFRQLANTIPQLAWTADASGSVYWYNHRWYDCTGTSPEQMEGFGWRSVHDPKALPWVLERWERCLELGETFDMTFPLRGKDGQYRPFYTLVAPLRDLSGKITQWFGTNTDVSSLHKTQDELQKAEAWLQESLASGRMVAIDWNLKTQKVKYSANSHPDDRARVDQAIKRAIREQGGYSELTRRIRPDTGELIWVKTQGTVIADGNGEPTFIRGIIIDVTKQVMAERDLMEASRRKDEFLAMLAHELRNPLAPISTASQLLRLAGNDQQRVRHSSEVIARQVRHMTALVDDLLDVSRVTRGLVELQNDSVDIKSVINSAIEQVRPLIESRDHQLNLRLGSTPALVYGDRTRLIQVIANLLNNACKYTAQHGIITLDLEVSMDHVNVKVSDNGSGIEASLLPHIFDLFTQGERTPDRAQGGLGPRPGACKKYCFLT